MKNYILIFLVLFSTVLFAQEKKSKLVTNVQLSHYLNQDGNGKFIPVNPGVELLYQFRFSENWSVATGGNYSYSKWELDAGSSQWRRKAHELFIPVQFERDLNYLTAINFGVYPGWLLDASEENKNKFSNNEWIDVSDQFNYDESQKFACDLYLGFKIKLDSQKNFSFLMWPFIKYKLTDNWMEQRRKPFSFGVNLSFLVGV